MTLSYNDYTIGWVCALPIEMAAARAMLDEIHPSLPQPESDSNSYALGRIHTHNIVIACLPGGVYGTTSAAVVANQMITTFRRIKLGLMVGVGGGVPSSPLAEVRLGDVVVSYPTGRSPGVVAYDYGKTLENGVFMQTGSLNKPPAVLLTAVGNLRASYILGKGKMADILGDVVTLFSGFAPPDISSPNHLVREGDPVKAVRVHHGVIASGNQVMKDAVTRDRLAAEHGILCFEMEAAGLMDHFPCMVIRGICDYSDASKSKEWQPFAAAAAAAYGKELLQIVPEAEEEQTKVDVSENGHHNDSTEKSTSRFKPLPFNILHAVFPAELSFLGSLTTDMASPRQNFHAPVKPPSQGQFDLITQGQPHSIQLSPEGRVSVHKLLSNDSGFVSGSEVLEVERSSSCILGNSDEWFEELSTKKAARKWIEKQIMRSVKRIYLVVGFRSLWHPDISTSHDYSSKSPIAGEVVYSVQYRTLKFKWFRKRDIDAATLEKGNSWKSLYTDRGDDDDEDEVEDWLQVTLQDSEDEDEDLA